MRASWRVPRATPARWRSRWAGTASPARWQASCRAPAADGLLPGGRGNDLARKLGIGHDPVAAVDILAAGRERSIDVAEAGGTSTSGILSAGFDSEVNKIANSTRLPLGTQVYAYGALRALWSWTAARLGGRRRRCRARVQRVRGGGGELGRLRRRHVAGAGRVAGGRAARRRVHRAPAQDRVPARAHKVFKGTHVDDPGFTIVRGREITFQASRPFTAYADGDPIADLPTTVRVLPGALRVIAP